MNLSSLPSDLSTLSDQMLRKYLNELLPLYETEGTNGDETALPDNELLNAINALKSEQLRRLRARRPAGDFPGDRG